MDLEGTKTEIANKSLVNPFHEHLIRQILLSCIFVHFKIVQVDSGWQFVVSMEQNSAQDKKSLHSSNLLPPALAKWQADPDIKSVVLL